MEQLNPILKRRALDYEIGYVLTEYQKSDDEGKEACDSNSYWANDFTIWQDWTSSKKTTSPSALAWQTIVSLVPNCKSYHQLNNSSAAMQLIYFFIYLQDCTSC